MTKDFFVQNRKKFLNEVNDNSLSIFFSGRALQKSNDQEFEFEVDKNFYYLSGINQANVTLALIKKGNTVKEVLFIEKNDEVLSKWVGLKLTIEETQAISGIDTVQYSENFNNFLYAQLNPTRASTTRVKNVYLNLERRNVEGYTNQALELVPFMNNKYPEITIHNAYEIVIKLRMYKNDEEIALIKESINTTRYAIEMLMKKTKPKMTEYQIESYFDWYIKYYGQKDTAFKTIAASGKNATILHYVHNNKVVEENDLILFDLGSRTNFYVSDITRCVPASGKFTPRQREIYSEVLNVNKLCIEFLKEGTTFAEYNKYAKDLLIKAAKRLGLIKEDQEIEKYYYHSVGHFMGLDTHDPGLTDFPFAEGMVVTCEPGLYVAEEGIGVRIEDDVLITKNGPVNLSKDIIKEIDEIEKFMATHKE